MFTRVVAYSSTCVSLGGGPLLDGGVHLQQPADDSCLLVRAGEAGAEHRRGREASVSGKKKKSEGGHRKPIFERNKEAYVYIILTAGASLTVVSTTFFFFFSAIVCSFHFVGCSIYLVYMYENCRCLLLVAPCTLFYLSALKVL